MKRNVGNAILAAGILTAAYGATAFWLIKSMPPNGGPSGRLPSLYVMAIGLTAMLLGAIIRDVRESKRRRE